MLLEYRVLTEQARKRKIYMKAKSKKRDLLRLLIGVSLAIGLMYIAGSKISLAIENQNDPNAVAPAGTYSNISMSANDLTSISNDTTINNVPNLGSAAYFWSHQINFVSEPKDGGAYIGIQGTNKAIFSVFNWPSAKASPTCEVKQSGFDAGAYSFGGTACHIDYTITQGHTYKLAVTKVGQDAQGNDWVGTVTDTTTGSTTGIGTINIPTSWGNISNSSSAWTEYFAANATPVGDCTKIPPSDITFSNFNGTKNGAPVPIGSHTNSITQNKCKDYSSITDINNNSFNQKMGIKNNTPSPTPTPGTPPTTIPPGSGSGPGGNAGIVGNASAPGLDQAAVNAAKVQVAVKERTDATNCSGPRDCISKNPLIKSLGLVFDVLSAIVAMAVVGVIIYGGIRYSASGGDPNAVAQAKKIIANAILAFVGYIFLYAFLQWLVPGGLF